MNHTRDDGGIDQNGSSGNGKKCLDLRYILEVESTELIGRLERCLSVSDLNN